MQFLWTSYISVLSIPQRSKSVKKCSKQWSAGATTNRNFLLIFISANGTIWLFGLRARGAGPAPAQCWASVFYVAPTSDKRIPVYPPANRKHLYSICATSANVFDVDRRCTNVIQMFCGLSWPAGEIRDLRGRCTSSVGIISTVWITGPHQYIFGQFVYFYHWCGFPVMTQTQHVPLAFFMHSVVTKRLSCKAKRQHLLTIQSRCLFISCWENKVSYRFEILGLL